MKKIITILLCLIFSSTGVLASGSDWTKTFRIRTSSPTISDASKLAEHDIVIMNKNMYDDHPNSYPTTFDYMRALNSDIELYLYLATPFSSSIQDGQQIMALNTTDRWSSSRNHTQGATDADHWNGGANTNGLFLVTSGGARITSTNTATHYYLDFSQTYGRNYIKEVLINDFVCSDWSSSGKLTCNTPVDWVADGIFSDIMTMNTNIFKPPTITYKLLRSLK